MATRVQKKAKKGTGGVPWGASDLQRRYRQILDAAKDLPQLVRDSDGSMLVVETEQTSRFERELAEHVADVALFQRVFAKGRKVNPKRWAHETPFPYLATLSAEEAEDFAKELLSYTLDAAQRGTLENLRGNLRAWESTAETYENKAALASMTSGIELGEIEEVFAPKAPAAR